MGRILNFIIWCKICRNYFYISSSISSRLYPIIAVAQNIHAQLAMGEKRRKAVTVLMMQEVKTMILNYFFMWFILKRCSSNSLFTFMGAWGLCKRSRRAPDVYAMCIWERIVVIVLMTETNQPSTQMFTMCLTIYLIFYYVSITAHVVHNPKW